MRPSPMAPPLDPKAAKTRTDNARATLTGAACAFIGELDDAGAVGRDNLGELGQRLARLRRAVAAYQRTLR